jgi:inorganic pyrophosphatase
VCIADLRLSTRERIPLKNEKNRRALADPSQLKPWDSREDKLVQVVIETPKASRNKYDFDQDLHVFELRKVLPAGMTFPYDFGFVPSTLADDGDPLDVLVLMDEPAFPGCVLKCRLIGIIEGQQLDKEKKKIRNDRIVAIEKHNHSFADIEHIDDLGNKFLDELEEFFVNYHRMLGKKYEVTGVGGPRKALRAIENSRKALAVKNR